MSNQKFERYLIQIHSRRCLTCSNRKSVFKHTLFWVFCMVLVLVVFVSHFSTPPLKVEYRIKTMDVSYMMKDTHRKPPPLVSPKINSTQSPSIKKETVEKKAPIPPVLKKTVTEVSTPVKRKVFGLRKIRSRGLGNNSTEQFSLITKIGNTISAPHDTIKAMDSDLKGELISVAQVSELPKIIVMAKPNYSKKMKVHQVTGQVKAKVLVDITGQVQKVIILHDLGFGTRQSSIDAIKKMEFKPALLNDKPVAVWIPLTFTFELQA